MATATADKQSPFGAQFQKLPAFLRELRPTMARLGDFADQATPVWPTCTRSRRKVSR